MASGLTESGAQRDLWIACGLFFVASAPNAVRQAQALDIDDPVSGAVAAHLFGFIFVAPLLFYLLAAVLHLIARAFGGTGGFRAARVALFWTALLGGPLAIVVSVAGVLGEIAAGPDFAALAGYLSILAFAYWLWLLANATAEAEGFRDARRVVLVLGAACVGIWALLGTAIAAGAG